MKKKGILFLTIALLIILIGGTYAWYRWTSSNNNVTFNVEGITISYSAGADITGVKLLPVTTLQKGLTDGTAIEKTITVSGTGTSKLTLNMDIEILDNGLKHETFIYQLYKGNELVNSGNFLNGNAGDTIVLLPQEQVSATTTTYKLYIWIDGSRSNPVTMGGQNYKFVLNASASNNQNEYVVTFDPDGGNINNNYKLVTYNQNYGTLPTPTKEGYTFLGWHGKNFAIFSPTILSADRVEKGITWSATSENTVHISGTATGSSFLTPPFVKISSNLRKLEAGTYTLSTNLSRSTYDHVYIYGFYDGDTASTTYAQGVYNGSSKKFTISEDAYVNIQIMISAATTIDQEVWVQLEKGNKATEYEPYYVTSNVKVTQNNNHTLTAIWQKN